MTFNYPSQAILISADSINDSDRTRTDFGDLDGLAESIKTNGLIHPPVVDASNRLIAGGRRVRAIRDILKEPQIPVLVLETLDDAHLAILEAEENIRRKAPTWQERVLGVAKVHEIAKRGAVLNSRRWTIVETGEMLGVAFSSVNNALTLARFIRAGDEEIVACSQITEALRVLLTRREREATKAAAAILQDKGVQVQIKSSADTVARLTAAADSDESFFSTAPSGGVVAPLIDADEMPGASQPSTASQVEIPLSKLVHKGAMEDLCYSLGSGFCDHVITDPPYAIDMANLDQTNHSINDIDSVKIEHDVIDNLALYEKMFPAVHRALRDNGFFIFFYDLDHHEKLQKLARETGFAVQRWPLIWSKSHACINQAAGKNWTKNYEVAMVCRKGNATLLCAQSSSIWTGTADDLKVQLGHPFVKPLKLWQWLFNAVAMRGQTILDPFAGVGSSTIAAIESNLLPIAFELNSAHYDRLVINAANAFRRVNPNTKFT